MNKIFLIGMVALLLQNYSFAQVKKNKNLTKRKAETTTVVDSVKWKLEHYIVNRDSAYANPRFALKKLQGGNRRFVEGLTVRLQQ